MHGTRDEPQVTGKRHAKEPRPSAEPAAAEQSAAVPVVPWVESVRPRLVRLASHMLGNAADAEEVVQDALALAWQRKAGEADEARRNAWAYRVTINLSLNRRRRRRAVEPLDARSLAAVRSNTPSAEAFELADRVRAAVQDLPDMQRAGLALREVEGLDYEAIAAILEVKPGAARVLVHRAREALRLMLLRRWPDTFG